MIIFAQLKVSDDGNKLFINAYVNKADYFKDIYIDSVTIMTADKVSENAPELPSTDDEGNPVDYIYYKKFEEDTKYVDLVLSANDFLTLKTSDISQTLFFVYIKCRGISTECTPCTLDELTTVGVTFDDKVLYQKVMNYTKSIADTCNTPTGFMDFILLWNAFKASIETDHYITAIKYWNMLFGKDKEISISYKDCGCNG